MLSPEAFCDNVKTALLANIGAALQAQTDAWAARDAAAGRTIELDVPREQDVYIGGAPLVVRYPTIEIAVADLSFANLSLENFDGDANPRLLIRGLFKLARDPEWLYRMACRWASAVIAVAATPGVFGPVDIDKDRGISARWRFNPETDELDQVQTGVLLIFELNGPLSPFFA